MPPKRKVTEVQSSTPEPAPSTTNDDKKSKASTLEQTIVDIKSQFNQEISKLESKINKLEEKLSDYDKLKKDVDLIMLASGSSLSSSNSSSQFQNAPPSQPPTATTIQNPPSTGGPSAPMLIPGIPGISAGIPVSPRFSNHYDHGSMVLPPLPALPQIFDETQALVKAYVAAYNVSSEALLRIFSNIKVAAENLGITKAKIENCIRRNEIHGQIKFKYYYGNAIDLKALEKTFSPLSDIRSMIAIHDPNAVNKTAATAESNVVVSVSASIVPEVVPVVNAITDTNVDTATATATTVTKEDTKKQKKGKKGTESTVDDNIEPAASSPQLDEESENQTKLKKTKGKK